MDMIDDMETACQLLKEGEILCIREGERVLFFGLRNEHVQVMSAQAHYVLDLCAFAEMFAGEQLLMPAYSYLCLAVSQLPLHLT